MPPLSPIFLLGQYVAQAGLQLTMYHKLASDFQSYLSFEIVDTTVILRKNFIARIAKIHKSLLPLI